METKNLGYSVKNIPISNKDVYLKALIGKTEHFIRRVRWKVFHFLNNPENKDEKNNTYGFRTLTTPPKHQILYNFENDLYKMIKNIEFEPVRNSPSEILIKYMCQQIKHEICMDSNQKNTKSFSKTM